MREVSRTLQNDYSNRDPTNFLSGSYSGSRTEYKHPHKKVEDAQIVRLIREYDIGEITIKNISNNIGLSTSSISERFGRMRKVGYRTTIHRPKLIREDYRNVIDDIEPDSVSLILTDPPYGVRYEPDKHRHAGEERMIGDSVNGLSHTLKGIGSKFDMLLRDGCCAMVFGSWKTFPRMAKHFKPLELKDVIIWDKDEGGHGLGNIHWIAPRHEFIMVFVKGSPRALNGSRLPNVIRYPNIRAKCNHKERCEVCGNLLSDSNGQILRPADTKYHKTQKPTGLLEHLIERFTYREEMVADFFAGSHSTSIAAMRTGRRCIGVEIEDEFHEVGKRRVAEEEKNWKDHLWDGSRGVFIERGDEDE